MVQHSCLSRNLHGSPWENVELCVSLARRKPQFHFLLPEALLGFASSLHLSSANCTLKSLHLLDICKFTPSILI